MVVLCGVDGSAPAREAARAAAGIAKRAGDALQLVYVQDAFLVTLVGPDGAEAVPLASQQLLDADRRLMQEELDRLAATLSREFQVHVGTSFEIGFPERELARCAEGQEALFLVVGAVGRRKGSMWRLGSIPDRLSQSARVPVLIVREAQGFGRWALEDRPLRVVLALGRGASTVRALQTASELRRLGPCEVAEAHVYDPQREAGRLGLRDFEGPEARRMIESTLARELTERFPGEVQCQVRLVASSTPGHVAEVLSEFAESERADLVVAGARGRGALRRRFLGSVSYGLVGLSAGNVLVAHEPTVPKAGVPRVAASVRRVLAATDLSESGNRVVDYALAVLSGGGQLTLLHVLPPAYALLHGPEESRLDRSLAQAELRKLLPAQTSATEVEVEVVEGDDVSLAILQAAERDGVDLVILGRHGRGQIAGALMGSVARAVAGRSPRPVLLVPDQPAGG